MCVENERIRTCIFIYKYMCMCIYIYTCMYARTHVRTYVGSYVRMYVVGLDYSSQNGETSIHVGIHATF